MAEEKEKQKAIEKEQEAPPIQAPAEKGKLADKDIESVSGAAPGDLNLRNRF
jgi:hypothetical protein